MTNPIILNPILFPVDKWESKADIIKCCSFQLYPIMVCYIPLYPHWLPKLSCLIDKFDAQIPRDVYKVRPPPVILHQPNSQLSYVHELSYSIPSLSQYIPTIPPFLLLEKFKKSYLNPELFAEILWCPHFCYSNHYFPLVLLWFPMFSYVLMGDPGLHR